MQGLLDGRVGLGEDGDFGMAGKVFHLHKGHFVALFGDEFLQAGDEHARLHRAGTEFAYLLKGEQAQPLHIAAEGLERVAGKVEAQRILFEGELLVVFPFRGILLLAGEANPGNRGGFCGRGDGEQGYLGGILFLLFFLGACHHVVEAGQHTGAAHAEAVAGAALDKAFEHALCHLAQVHAGAEVEQGLVRAGGIAAADYLVDGFVAHVFHAAKAIDDGFPAGREGAKAYLHVGREHFDVHVAAGGDIVQYLVLIAYFGREQGGHELDLKVML